jgi:hypothetical protein
MHSQFLWRSPLGNVTLKTDDMESYFCCGRSAQALRMDGWMGRIFRVVAIYEISVSRPY